MNPTDEQLAARAEKLTQLFALAGYGAFTQDPERIYYNVVLLRLKDARESLRLLEIRTKDARDELREYPFKDWLFSRIEEANAHIAHLRELLGITE
jgi:hypothetical protein